MKSFNEKKLPVDIQAFETMRGENYLYIDKTRHIYQMITEGRFYFLSRPRRFGKSLLVSTLKCLFQGRKDLFEGLWIAEQSEWDWGKHVVVAIDFNEIGHDSPEAFKGELEAYLQDIAQEYQIQLDNPTYVSQFKELLRSLHTHTGMPVVVLIDEYDKAILDHLGKGSEGLLTAKANRDILKNFFGVLKGGSIVPFLRFVFLTGISRFSRVSIFSELNNLIDISMDNDYADILGYTQQELDTCFHWYIRHFATGLAWPPERIVATLAQQYNGYRFAERDIQVYNPFSILHAFRHQQFKDYWFESATPSFLIHLLKQTGYNLPTIEGIHVSRSIFTTFDLDRLQPEALLFQTGYLTIKDIHNGVYTLDYPNQEVKRAFSESLLFSLTEEGRAAISSHVLQLPGYLAEEKFEAFFETMTAIFAAIPYAIASKRDEAYFHTIFYLMLSASGLAVQSSVLTSEGKIDLVLIVSDKVYIVEFKCNQSAQAALQQIHNKHYADKYRRSDKKIFLIGINFSTEVRNLAEWDVKELET